MYSSSHAGMEGHALTWYFGELIVSTGLALLLAALQIIDGIRRRSAVTWIIAVFAVTYFVFISLFQIRNDRTLLPVIPCVLALAAMFVVRVARDDDLLRKRSPKTRQALAAVCLIAMIVTPLGATVSRTLQLTRLDSRTTARVWMDANLPEHAIVAVESYSPYVDYRRFHIVYAERAIDHPPQWYFDQGVNFLVLNQGALRPHARYRRLSRSDENISARETVQRRRLRRADLQSYAVAALVHGRANRPNSASATAITTSAAPSIGIRSKNGTANTRHAMLHAYASASGSGIVSAFSDLASTKSRLNFPGPWKINGNNITQNSSGSLKLPKPLSVIA
jgi:hypothetical protein